MGRVLALFCLCLLLSSCATKPQNQSHQFFWKKNVLSGAMQHYVVKKQKVYKNRTVANQEGDEADFDLFDLFEVLTTECTQHFDISPFARISVGDDDFESLVRSNKDRLRHYLTTGDISLTSEEKEAKPEALKCMYLTEGILATGLHPSNPIGGEALRDRLFESVGMNSPWSQIHAMRVNSCKPYEKPTMLISEILKKDKSELFAEEFYSFAKGLSEGNPIEELLLLPKDRSNPEALRCAYSSVGFVFGYFTNHIIFALTQSLGDVIMDFLPQDQHEVFATTEKNEDFFNKVRVLSSTAQEQIEALDIDGAKVTLQKVLEMAEKIENSDLKDWELRRIARMQVGAGDINGALTTAEKIEDSYDKDRALSFIAVAQAEAGDIDGALTTAEKIENSDLKASVLKRIAQVQEQIKD